MRGTLKNIQVSNEPEDTREVIRSTIKSPLGNIWMWIIVEDEDDQAVYEKFVHKYLTQVRISRLANGSKGCNNVELIVKETLDRNITEKIVGIRDADYTRYMDYAEHPNIKRTDERDIEMQMLASASVLEGLKMWNAAVPEHLDWIYTNVARERGCMRLISDVDDLGCSFKDEAPISHLWDESHGKMRENWQRTMFDEFFDHCKNKKHYGRTEYLKRKQQLNLNGQSTYKLCQGHDVVSMLQYRLHNSNINTDAIMKKMTNSYLFEDFRNTKLYSDLLRLSEIIGVNYLKTGN